MSYQVLARKWRPQVFEDVVGQAHITRTLQNAITTNRLAHDFLFSGPRGVGKTTTARILAKALNCSEGPTPTPCGKCDSCRETTAGTSVDVIEIDGASNRGIEHIRELREAVKYAPAGGKNKVYVIDEVHMLTNEAFNALLKTLEEPPPHVIFIFATTEPQKIPATILSRCQRYGFKRVSLQEISGRLRAISDAEGITITEEGLAMIARAAEGSMRDSQSLLDQAVSYSGLTIKDDELQATLGSVAQQALRAFAAGLLARDAAGLLLQIDGLLEQGQDLRQFLAGVVEHLRNVLVVKISPDASGIVELPTSDLEAITQQAAGATTEQLLMFFDSLSKTLDEMRWSLHQRFSVEVGIIKACSLAPLKPLAEVLGRMKEIETRLASGHVPASRPAAAPAASGVTERSAGYGSPRVQQAAPAIAASRGPGQNDPWSSIFAAVKAKKPGLATFLAQGSLVEVREGELVIGMKGSAFHREQLEKQENRELLEAVAAEQLGRKVRVRIQAAADDPKPAPSGAAKAKQPAKPKPQEQDPLVQDALRIFGGEVIDQDPGAE